MSSLSKPPRILIVGAGMTRFARPQSPAARPYDQLAAEAAAEAIADAGGGLTFADSVTAVVASYCYGDPACGQRAVYRLGLTGIPVYNVNNNCSSGSSALALARALLLSSGSPHRAVLVLGFEQMERGGLSQRYPEKPDPVGRHCERVAELGVSRDLCAPGMSQWTSDVIRMFSGAAAEYRDRHGNASLATPELLAEVAHKARRHGAQNPRALLFSSPLPGSPAELLKSPAVSPPLHVAFCAPVATGAACVVMTTEAWWAGRRMPVTELVDQEVVSDFADTFGPAAGPAATGAVGTGGFGSLCGLRMAEVAAKRLYQRQGVRPGDQLDLVELHDCFSSNELMLYEALGLADPGCGPEYFRSGSWVASGPTVAATDEANPGSGRVYRTGRAVVNPSGGLVSKGHPIGATGVAQCAEISWQHRGLAGARQVAPRPDWALQHNFGLGSSCAVTLYRRFGEMPTGARL